MAAVSVYLNFERNAEEAFNFYKSVFKTEFIGLMRYSEVTPEAGMPPLPDADKNLIMHVALPILGGHVLMGGDVIESMGGSLVEGNNVYIVLQPDTRSETQQLFKALSDGGKVQMELQDMFWGDYFGDCIDKFGIHWMFNCAEKK